MKNINEEICGKVISKKTPGIFFGEKFTLFTISTDDGRDIYCGFCDHSEIAPIKGDIVKVKLDGIIEQKVTTESVIGDNKFAIKEERIQTCYRRIKEVEIVGMKYKFWRKYGKLE